MGAFYLTVLALGAVVLAAPEKKSSVTHEDIRDAMLSMVHMVQVTTQKLERHELRERQLGEQLRKALGGLDSRERSQDSAIAALAATLARLDSKMDALQAQIHQQDERQKGSYTIDTVPLQSWMSNVEGMLTKQTPGAESVLSKGQLERMESEVNSKIDSLTDAVHRIEVTTLARLQSPQTEEIQRQLSLQEKWHQDVLVGLDDLRRVSLEILNSNPGTDNYTKEELARIRSGLDYLTSDRLMNLEVKLQETARTSNEQLPSLSRNILELNAMMTGQFADLMKSQEEITNGIKSIPKVEQVLIQTADNVLDTKRRVEFGVQEILLGLGEQVRTEAKEINDNVNDRFNDISQTILENQNFGLTNLSSKIEMEISQVWRQIGIMYQQLTESTNALGKLQKQTEQYVNGSLNTMDNMDGRVEEITGRVSDVKENLNYLMGRLLLVTQEFNQTKGDLAVAFENLRNTFKSVRKDAKDLGPGPNPIEEQEDNKL